MSFKDPFSAVPLKVKLPMGFMALFLCVVGAGGYFVLSSVYAPLTDEITRRLENEAYIYAALIDHRLESIHAQVDRLSGDNTLRAYTGTPFAPVADAADLRQRLSDQENIISKEFLDVQVYDADYHRLSGIREPGVDISHYIEPALWAGEHGLTRIVPPNAVDAFPTAAMISPLQARRGDRPTGYLVCTVDLAAVIGQALSKRDPEMGDAPRITSFRLADGSGQTLDVSGWYLASLLRRPTPIPEERGIGFRLLSGKTARSMGQTRPGQLPDREGYRYTRTLTSTDWKVAIEMDMRQALRPLNILEGRFAGIAGIMATAILSLLFLSVRYVVRPLSELRRMAQRIREGDFSARNAIDSEDEIGMLARTANLMAEAVQDRTAHLERTADDLNRREQELRVQHNLLDKVIQSMTDGVMLVNGHGTVVLSNRAAAPLVKSMGQFEEPLVIQKCEHQEMDSSRCAACICNPTGPTSCVLTVHDTVYEVLSTQVRIEHDRSKVLVARDITEREAMHRQQAHQERLAVLGRLSAVVAHEMNNPLAAISLYNQMMEAELPPSSPYAEHVDVIGRNTQSCQRIIRELLDYARTPQPHIEEIDLRPLIADVVRFLRPLHQKPDIDIRFECGEESALCWGDAVQLQQVIVNLLVNAFQAVEDRRGRVCIRLSRETDSSLLIIDVEDDGAGIPLQLAQEIFEPFFTTKRSGGTGLGLPTARRIMETHGGALELYASRPGKTVFRVTVPALSDDAAAVLLPVDMTPHQA